jgi:hypothetical protein
MSIRQTSVGYVREYLDSMGIDIGDRENAGAVGKKLAAFLGCSPPTNLRDANNLIDAFAIGKKAQLLGSIKQKRINDWFKPLQRKPYEYKSTRHIPSVVAGERVYWSPV